MNTNHKIPYEFQESIFPDYVQIATGNAIIGAQYVERVLNGICLMLRTQGLNFTIGDFLSKDSARTRQTLGDIRKQLNGTNLFKHSFDKRLTQFAQRRNRLVHGLFADTFVSRSEIDIKCPKAHRYIQECEWVANEASELVEVGFGIYHVIAKHLLAAHPNESHLTELVAQFDDFLELGLGVTDSNLIVHLIEQRGLQHFSL